MAAQGIDNPVPWQAITATEPPLGVLVFGYTDCPRRYPPASNCKRVGENAWENEFGEVIEAQFHPTRWLPVDEHDRTADYYGTGVTMAKKPSKAGKATTFRLAPHPTVEGGYLESKPSLQLRQEDCCLVLWVGGTAGCLGTLSGERLEKFARALLAEVEKAND